MAGFTPDVLSLPASHIAFHAGSPLKRSATTGEPYLPLSYRFPSGHQQSAHEIILTPARHADVPARIEQISDPSVDPWLWSPLKPYTHEAALERFLQMRQSEQDIFEDWVKRASSTSSSERGLCMPGGLPLGAIRSRDSSDGTDMFLGEMGARREDDYMEIMNAIERERAIEQNLAKPNGDPNILWTWFFSLHPRAAGKGLMTSVLHDVMRDWLVPILNMHEMISFAFCGNEGSRRVHLKLGFEEIGTDWIRMPEYRGGQMREEWVFRWSLSKQEHEGADTNRVLAVKAREYP